MRYWYSESGKIIKSCNHIDGLRQGDCINYNQDGTIKSIWNYVDNEVVY